MRNNSIITLYKHRNKTRRYYPFVQTHATDLHLAQLCFTQQRRENSIQWNSLYKILPDRSWALVMPEITIRVDKWLQPQFINIKSGPTFIKRLRSIAQQNKYRK